MSKVISVEDIENSKDKRLSFKLEEQIEGINSVGPICADLIAGSPGKSSSTSFLLSVFLEYNISSVEGKSFCLNCFMMSPMHLHLQ